MKLLIITIILAQAVQMYPIKAGITPQLEQTEPMHAQKRKEFLKEIKKDHVSIFFNNHWDEAKAIEDSIGTPKGFILAQWALESKWGDSRFAKERLNFAGIKRNHVYCTYPDIKAFYADYLRVITCDCYRPTKPNVADWIEATKRCGYAKSKKYQRDLNKIIKRWKLDSI